MNSSGRLQGPVLKRLAKGGDFMKRNSLIVLTAAAILTAGVAGAAEQADQPAAKPVTVKTSKAVQTCKDQGKTGKELNECVHAERQKEREARQQERAANKQQASAPSQDAQPVK
jgi:hypothetical protein